MVAAPRGRFRLVRGYCTFSLRVGPHTPSCAHRLAPRHKSGCTITVDIYPSLFLGSPPTRWWVFKVGSRDHRAASQSPCGASARRRVFAVSCCHGVRARAPVARCPPAALSHSLRALGFQPSLPASLCRSGGASPHARGPPASRSPSGCFRAVGRTRGSPAPALRFATLRPWRGIPSSCAIRGWCLHLIVVTRNPGPRSPGSDIGSVASSRHCGLRPQFADLLFVRIHFGGAQVGTQAGTPAAPPAGSPPGQTPGHWQDRGRTPADQVGRPTGTPPGQQTGAGQQDIPPAQAPAPQRSFARKSRTTTTPRRSRLCTRCCAFAAACSLESVCWHRELQVSFDGWKQCGWDHASAIATLGRERMVSQCMAMCIYWGLACQRGAPLCAASPRNTLGATVQTDDESGPERDDEVDREPKTKNEQGTWLPA